ncbi:mechanosensitive ion channel protein [Halobellus salinus]|uniref:Mechanosensitive ion channel protein n=1 Tax=Halobellus salinus TaxID=931585 RepID=A0A830EB95_9EURY|nr:mechanosensitive ion channel family protein [Halobellus salinus]GGJ09043.1 mechanosensitive ion channel protein [Halobellus salinus]SMP27150.1 Mechanosensitive ion channel [Halobellus salinus]
MSFGGALQVGVGLSGSISRFLAGIGLPDTAAGLLGQLFAFLAVFVGAYLAGRNVLIPLVNRMMVSRDLEPHARRPIRRLIAVLVGFAAITAAFGAAGYPDFLRSLATIAAAATLAIGFAMQDVLQNFVAGIFIYTDKPFKIGDWIKWDGNSGIVEDISFRVTRVKTFDNELLTVPNSQLTDGVIKNPVAKGTLRLQVPFGIGYDDDIETATDIILEEARTHEDILEDPAPSVRLTELGDSSVTLTSRIWIDDPSRSDFVRTRGEYVQTVKRRFDDEDINIPYPNRTLGGELTVSGPGEVEPAGE